MTSRSLNHARPRDTIANAAAPQPVWLLAPRGDTSCLLSFFCFRPCKSILSGRVPRPELHGSEPCCRRCAPWVCSLTLSHAYMLVVVLVTAIVTCWSSLAAAAHELSLHNQDDIFSVRAFSPTLAYAPCSPHVWIWGVACEGTPSLPSSFTLPSTPGAELPSSFILPSRRRRDVPSSFKTDFPGN